MTYKNIAKLEIEADFTTDIQLGRLIVLFLPPFCYLQYEKGKQGLQKDNVSHEWYRGMREGREAGLTEHTKWIVDCAHAQSYSMCDHGLHSIWILSLGGELYKALSRGVLVHTPQEKTSH